MDQPGAAIGSASEPLPAALPAGTLLRSLSERRDDRGTLTEIFRNEWSTAVEPVQWNLVKSARGVLRGVHVHPRHRDYVTVIHGTMHVALVDMRRASPTFHSSTTVALSDQDPHTLTIPAGVAHAFWTPEPTTFIYGVDSYWSLDDELGCRWDDPDLGLTWPADLVAPQLSDRDRQGQSFADLSGEFDRAYVPPANG